MRRIASVAAILTLVTLAAPMIAPASALASVKYQPVKTVRPTMGDFGTTYRRSISLTDTGVAEAADYCLTFKSHKFFYGSALVLSYAGKRVSANRFLDANSTQLSRYVKGSVCFPVPRTAADAKRLRKRGYQPLLRGHTYTFQIYVAGNSDFKRYYKTLTFRIPRS